MDGISDAQEKAPEEQNKNVKEETSVEIPEVGLPSSDLSNNDKIMLPDEGIEIFFNKPLSDFTRLRGAKTYLGRASAGKEYVAYMCQKADVPRINSIANYKSLQTKNIMPLKKMDIVYWPPEKKDMLTFVFEHPGGAVLAPDINGKIPKLDENLLLEGLVRPILHVLQEFEKLGLVHGAINPTNMFLSNTDENTSVILGECLSTACSYTQHKLFETIERSMADPLGRGETNAKGDLYAFGMSVALLARGYNPLQDLKDAEGDLLAKKMDVGSYGLVIGRERLPGGITEFLRGVLSDDEGHRWSIDDAIKWLEGRRLSPKQSKVEKKAARPYTFKGRKHMYLRGVAYDFSLNVSDAVEVIEDKKFMEWVRRNFDDKVLDLNLDAAIKAQKQTTRNKDQQIAVMCMALDPQAPLRYKGLTVLPAGFGAKMAEVMCHDGDVQPFGEIIVQQLFNFWSSMQVDTKSEAVLTISKFDKCRSYLSHKIGGYGVERILYTLCRDVTCLSPQLKNYFVINPSGLLLALEKMAAAGDKPNVVLDRHMLAFISIREPKMIDPHLGAVVSKDRKQQVIGTIRTLATIQKRFSVGELPHLCNWMISIAPPAIDIINNRDLRKKMSDKINSLSNKGDLKALLDIIDDIELLTKDDKAYALAKVKYYKLSLESGILSKKIKTNKDIGRGTGRHASMVFSAVLSCALIIGFLVIHFIGGR